MCVDGITTHSCAHHQHALSTREGGQLTTHPRVVTREGCLVEATCPLSTYNHTRYQSLRVHPSRERLAAVSLATVVQTRS